MCWPFYMGILACTDPLMRCTYIGLGTCLKYGQCRFPRLHLVTRPGIMWSLFALNFRFELLATCWDEDAEKRPTFTQIVESMDSLRLSFLYILMAPQTGYHQPWEVLLFLNLFALPKKASLSCSSHRVCWWVEISVIALLACESHVKQGLCIVVVVVSVLRHTKGPPPHM